MDADIKVLMEVFKVDYDTARKMIASGFNVDAVKNGAEDIITTSSGIDKALEKAAELLKNVAADSQKGL